MRRVVGIAATAFLGLGCVTATAKVYDCVDPRTKAVTKSDIPCPTAQGPTMVEDVERAQAARLALIKEQIRRAAKRADDQLVEKYPDEATYRKLRAADLEPVIRQIGQATARFFELIAERKPLDLEAEFYKGKPLPAWLQKKIEASEISFKVQTQVFRDLEHELAGVVRKYQDPRERLGNLWAGEAPGSMGPLVSNAAVAQAK